MARRRPPTSRPAGTLLEARAIRPALYPRHPENPLTTVQTAAPPRTAPPALRRVARWAVRLVEIVGVLVGVATVAWFLLFLLRRNLFPPEPSGLEQYRRFVEGAFLHLDFGRSYQTGRPVTTHMREGLPVDFALLGGGLVAGLALGAAGGLVCALRPRSVARRAIETLATLAISTPVFVVALELLFLFGSEIGSAGLPVGIPIRYAPFRAGALDWLASMIAPWIVLGLPLAGLCVRTTAASATDVLAQDFVRAATARGVAPRRIARRHVLPVALSPALAIGSASAGLMLMNMVLVERAFALPGFMQLVTRSVGQADVPVLLGLSVTGALFVVLTTAALQAIIDRLDPRARRA